MDNCEVSMGLYSAYSLLTEVLLPKYSFFTWEYWKTAKEILALRMKRHALIAAINNKMWNQSNELYEVGISSHGNIIEFASWDEFYPNATAQLFPIVFGVIPANSDRAVNLYNRFCQEYSWEQLSYYTEKKTGFYWGITAYCGSIMGDDEKVSQYISNFSARALPDLKYPVYNADIAWVILAGDYE